MSTLYTGKSRASEIKHTKINKQQELYNNQWKK